LSDILWRIEPEGTPAWAVRCSNCSLHSLEATGRFRVNSNGRRHDIWLLYRCPRCGRIRKRSLHRRVGAGELPYPLDAYRRDSPELLQLYASSVPLAARSPAYTVVKQATSTGSGTVVSHAFDTPGAWIRIVQCLPCGLRWDRFLANEWGLSRARVRALHAEGRIEFEPVRKLHQPVRDGDRFRVRAFDRELEE